MATGVRDTDDHVEGPKITRLIERLGLFVTSVWHAGAALRLAKEAWQERRRQARFRRTWRGD
jgi:hypothetical protein